MSCAKVTLNDRNPQNIHNTIFIIVAHLKSGAFAGKKKYSKTTLIVILLLLYNIMK